MDRRLRWVLSFVAGVLVLLGVLSGILLVRLRGERNDARSRVEELLSHLKKPAPAPAETPLERRIRELEARVRELETRPPDPAPSAPRAPDVKVVPSDPAESREVMRRIEARLYLAVTGMAEGDYDDALRLLSLAMALDAGWFRRVDPRTFFQTSPEKYRKLREALEERVRSHPLDVQAKVLLAYLYYHEKGPAHAKALLAEAVHVDPAHPEAKRFLEALDP